MDSVKKVPHCSHWGAYSLLVENGQIIGAEPFFRDPAPSSIIHSVKDWANPERRILRPMVREGWLSARQNSDRRGRGSERFIAVSWDEAADLVASEISRVAQDHGNQAIFAGSYGWTSCGRFHHAPTLLKRMLNLVGGYTGHVDTYSIAAGPVILRHALGNDDACVGRASTLDLIAQHSETLVVFGALSPRTAQNEAGGIGSHMLETRLREMVARGMRIVLVSPLADDIPDWVGADWWAIRPNTDTALLLGLAGEILRADLHDRAFLARCTSGSEVYLDYLSGQSDGQIKDAEWAGAITGLEPAAIRALARQLVETRSMLSLGWSLQRAQHGEQPYWAALGLAAMIGQIGLPGGGVGYGYASLGGVGAGINAGRSPAITAGRNVLDSFIPVARISDMLLQPGGSFTYEGQTRQYPDTRLVYWAGGNPFHHHQDLNRLNEAWTRPETIIVQDPMFTATAQRADIILPASTSIERNDLAGNRRMDVILAMGQAIAPLGEARSDFAIFDLIAQKLGVGEAFNEGRDEMGWLRHLYEQSRADAKASFGAQLPDFDSFWQQGYADIPVIEQHVYLSDFRQDPEAHPLSSESGRIVLGSQTLAQLGYEDCPPHPAWLPPQEWLGAARHDDEFHLISNQPNGRLHSQLETSPASMADKRNGREQVRLHPQDAERLGLIEGHIARLWNARGACLATVQLSAAVRPGVAVLPTGAWFTPSGNSGLDLSGNPNVLTPDIPTSRFGQGCAAHTCLVRIEPYGESAPDAIDSYRAMMSSLAAE